MANSYKWSFPALDAYPDVDGVSKFAPLDLSNCGIPSTVHALQWYEDKGWIEFSDDNDPFTPKPPNELINKLPAWANKCVQLWNDYVPPEPEPIVTE